VDRLSNVPNVTSFIIKGDSISGGPLLDTSKVYGAFKWTGINFTVVALADTDSSAFRAVVECGNIINNTQLLFDRCDSLDVSWPGTYTWQFNLPVAPYFRVIFSPLDTLTDARLDSCFLNRNW
jgi:hypothetical protein